jgi:endonuclease YncB( thermonuclease family)
VIQLKEKLNKIAEDYELKMYLTAHCFYITALLSLCGLGAPTDTFAVCHVADGDTLRLCNGQRIRLWGIDAPEMDQDFGINARDFLRQTIGDSPVMTDCSYGRSHKRRVCKVMATVKGTPVDVAEELVRRGLAFDYLHFSQGTYAAAEAAARAAGLGVWREGREPPGGVRPWDHRGPSTYASRLKDEL